MSRSKLLGAALALPLMFAAAGSAQANVIALNIDESGSISGADWTTQKTGYVNALNALIGPSNYGLNSIGVWTFDDQVRPIFAIKTINNAADLLALTTAIAGMTQHGGSTAIGDSVVTATTAITAFAGAGVCKLGQANCIIDVSTDGGNNTGVTANFGANTANTAGIKVNCVGVGGSADCSWNNAGADFTANNAAAFSAVILAKLSTEITKAPEPITLSLFGAGLFGAAALRRRKAKAA